MSLVLYDVVIVVLFGGLEGFDDVMLFLENVFCGCNVLCEWMFEVVEYYEYFGGVSLINE